MKIQKTLTKDLNAPADRVWNIMGTQFADIGNWSRNVMQSRPMPGAHVGDADVAGRVCKVKGFGDVEERLTEFNNTNQRFTLRVERGLPFFVRYSQFSSGVTPVTDGTSRYDLALEMDINPFFGAVLYPALNKNLSRTIDLILEDLKHYAETGKIHPDKLATRRGSVAPA